MAFKVGCAACRPAGRFEAGARECVKDLSDKKKIGKRDWNGKFTCHVELLNIKQSKFHGEMVSMLRDEKCKVFLGMVPAAAMGYA